MENAVELINLTKRFGKVVANDKANLEIRKGEILSLLGENGSGKTTLMNMLAGIYYQDEGYIKVNGEIVDIRSPKDAFKYGIGMVHQHLKLIDVFTASENIVLGLDQKFKLNMNEVSKKISSLAEKYGFIVDPNKKVYDMSISEKQTVEILKLLYRGTNILILDEPTAVLTPQETEKLFDVLRAMRDDGKSIIIITHKLQEVLELSDRVSILRKGKIIETIETKDANEEILTDAMVGQHIELNIQRDVPQNPQQVLRVDHLTCFNTYGIKALDDVSFVCNSGEILGIAGVAGSGQKELLESIVGLQKVTPQSSIVYAGPEKAPGEFDTYNLLKLSTKKIKEIGVSLAFVPEDRLGMGLVGNMNLVDNMLIRSYENGKTPFLKYKEPTNLAKEIKDKLEVVTPSIKTQVRKLSGGNVQKVLVGREIASSPRLLMTAYAVRGLDINTSYTIYNILNDEKKRGTAVIYVGEDLDVLLALCDRILVLCDGRVTGCVDARTTNKKEIGAMMAAHNSAVVEKGE